MVLDLWVNNKLVWIFWHFHKSNLSNHPVQILLSEASICIFTTLPLPFDWKYGRLVGIYIWMAIDCKCLVCQFMALLTTNSSSRKVNLLGQASIFPFLLRRELFLLWYARVLQKLHKARWREIIKRLSGRWESDSLTHNTLTFKSVKEKTGGYPLPSFSLN